MIWSSRPSSIRAGTPGGGIGRPGNVSSPAQRKWSAPRRGLRGDAEQVIAFGKGAHGGFRVRQDGLGRCIRRGPMCRALSPDGSRKSPVRQEGAKGTTGQGEGQASSETPSGSIEPRAIIFENGIVSVPRTAISSWPRAKMGRGAAVKVDMHLEVSHRETIRLFA